MKKQMVCILAIMTVMLAACGANEHVSDETKADIKLDKVDNVTDASANENTTRDYGDKKVEDGFWVQKNTTGKDEYYRYIPMMSAKLAGIYDWEDSESNKSMDTYAARNCPDGTKTAKLNGWVTTMGYYSNPQLGYNSNPDDETVQKNELVNYAESFALVADNNKKNVLQSYDVGCITFALYKDLYESFPEINMKLYGITETSIKEAVTDISECELSEYSAYIKSCADRDFSDCELLASKTIADSGIYYIDYRHLSETGNYSQYIIVLEFPQESGYAYYMNGRLCYNIDNNGEYNSRKHQHINQFIAE
uniref:hypothetical protein n=1 Tax=Lachnospira sp. TaxID=2049031 RepID=UPI004029D5CF